MGVYTLNVPQPNLTSPSSWNSRAGLVKQMNTIVDNYGKFIKFASTQSKIPAEVLTSFIAVESGGNPSAGASGHITQGLMQWNRTYAKSVLEAENSLGRLTPAEKDKLAVYGIKFDANGKTRAITNADQLKPELNILIGSIWLGQHTDGYYEAPKKDAKNWAVDKDGTLRMDRIIALYNAGAYGSIGKKARSGTHASPYELANDVPEPTKSYIKKIYGINGSMDVATSELKNKFTAL